MKMEKIKLLCDSHHGMYVPSIWCSNTDNIWNINSKDWEYLSDHNNLEDENYWDVWNDTLSNASYTDDNGVVWTLHQDGDLFAVAYDEMTEDEKDSLFGV